MSAIAVGEITIVDLHDEDVHIGPTPPDDPKDKKLWLDTSTVPNVMKRWDAATEQWIKASPTGAEDIGAEPIIIKAPQDPTTAMLVFARDSEAIHPETGAVVPVDTPIFMTFYEEAGGGA